jgi:hypothetical protein
VTTDPPLPSQISLNGQIADAWALSWLKVKPGSYTVHFSHIEGYTEPADQTVVVVAGQTTEVSGKFVQRGSLHVTTKPSEANGAIRVDGIPRNNATLWTDLPAGNHEVCFGAVVGFTPPACTTVALVAGKLTTVEGAYKANSAAPGETNVGSLRVTTQPSLPSQISLNGEIADTGAVNWLQLAPGSYTIHFSHVEGYTEPADQTVTITSGGTTEVTGTFVQRGYLHVVTSPAVAATITVDDIPRNEWSIWTDFPTGSHKVCFGEVEGLVAPPCQSVTVKPGELATVTGAYK